MKFQAQVQRPPDPIIREFLPHMRRVVGCWRTIERTAPDLVITSWYRSPDYNASVGGQPHSQHTVGCAMDGVSAALGRERLLSLALQIAPRYGCTALGSEGRAVHIQALPAGTVRAWAQRNQSVYRTAASTFVGPPRPVGV